MVKSTHPGNAARMGAEAAILANMGYTASAEALESPVGYAAALFGGNFNWDVATGGLGVAWRLTDPGFDIKRFPAQVYMQNVIEAVLTLRKEHGLSPESIEQVTIHRQGRGHSGPLPRSGLDGKFSVEYCAAAALLDGQVGIDTFTDARRFAGDMEDMLGRIRVEPEGPESGATLVTALLKNGATVRSECSAFRGSAKNPMSREERLVKVRDCFRRALSDSDAERVLEMLEKLEDLRDVGELMGVLGQVVAGR